VKKDADAELFARAMADVTRLDPDPRERVRPKPPAGAARTRARLAPPAVQRDDDDHVEDGFVAAGVNRREIRKLKRGDYDPGKRLDLHGMTAAQAAASVTRFIDEARGTHRCVCIVHGRGLHSARNVSILRARVRASLGQHRAVLAYADAPRTDGGSGAVYVLLRK